MKFKGNKFYITNPFSKEVYNEEFSDKEQLKNMLIEGRQTTFSRIASGRQLNAISKNKNIDFKIADISIMKERIKRKIKEEQERIIENNKRMARRGLL